MKAKLRTYKADTLIAEEIVNLPDNYDGDPYGDTVPFCVGSNQELIPIVSEITFEHRPDKNTITMVFE